jgi:hypothetical protein
MEERVEKVIIWAFPIVAVVSTMIAIYCSFKVVGVPWNIASPSETKLVEVDTIGDYVGGYAIATGEGKFTITRSDVEILQTGMTWKAYGCGGRGWDDTVTDWDSSTLDRVTVFCKIEIPHFELREPAHVRGYVSLPGKYPQRISERNFRDVEGQIDSEEFSLFLYPEGQRRSALLYSAFRVAFGIVAIFAWLGTVGTQLEKSGHRSLRSKA